MYLVIYLKKNSTCAHQMRLTLNRLNTSTSCDSVCKESCTYAHTNSYRVGNFKAKNMLGSYAVLAQHLAKLQIITASPC